MTAVDFDAWRVSYDAMTYDDHVRFYDAVWDAYPVQQHYDTGRATAFLARVDPRRVLELGGWRGELAAAILPEFPDIVRWRNVEVCRGAAENAACTDPRYEAIVPDAWLWERPDLVGFADTFVASHVIEHMRGDQLRALFAVVLPSVDAVFLASPLDEEGQGWAGYHGSHILELGWRDVAALLANAGFARYDDIASPEVRAYRRAP